MFSYAVSSEKSPWPKLFFSVLEVSEGRFRICYTGCPRRNVKYFGRVFLMLNYTDITQNTYIRS